jgi:hypothetical protein
MTVEIERLVATLEASVKGFEREMRRARLTADKEVKAIEDRTTRASAVISKSFAGVGVALRTSLGAVGLGALAGGLGLEAIISTAQQAAADLAKIGDQAAKIGITAEALQELEYAAEQNAGSAEAASSGLLRFAAGLADAQAGSGELLAILKANNVAFTDQNGKLLPTLDLLRRYADLIKNARTPAEQLELAIRAFGRSAGPELVTLLKDGGRGLDSFRQAARDAGAVLSNEMIAKAQEIDDKFAGIARTVSLNVKGAIVAAIEALGEFVTKLNEAQAKSSTLGKTGSDLVNRPVLGGSDVHAGDVEADARNGIVRLPYAGPSNRGNDPNDLTPALAPYTSPPPPKPPGQTTRLPASGSSAKSEAEKLAESYAKLQEAARARIADLAAEQASLGMTTAAAEALRYEQDLINRATQSGIQLTPQQREEIHALAQEYGNLKGAIEATSKSQEEAKRASEELSRMATDALGDMIVDGKSAQDVMADLAKQLARAALQAALLGSGPLAGLFGTSGSGLLTSLFTPGKAAGGMVGAGSPVMVGEQGRELFVPTTPGRIVPHHALRGNAARPSITVVQHIAANGDQTVAKIARTQTLMALADYDKRVGQRAVDQQRRRQA